MLWPSVKEGIALALLDWNNDYALKHVGVYWGRHGAATVLRSSRTSPSGPAAHPGVERTIEGLAGRRVADRSAR